MQLILVDFSKKLCAAWEIYIDKLKLPNITIANDRFENIPEYDCMVSPANSFGLMDGGIDAAITDYFGQSLMHNVQQHIIEHFLGEQPVGTSFIIETGHEKHKWLAHTPTMRVPIEITRTDNVYRAMWAMLRAVHHHNQTNEQKINKILCPGLGTGYGRVPANEAARQMTLAYHNYLNPPTLMDWHYAQHRQSQVRYGGDYGYRIPPIG